MSRRLVTIIIAGLIGLPVLIGLVVSMVGSGQSQVQVPTREVQWPAALAGLPATVTDLAVDDQGTVWFPVLKPPDQSGGRTNALYRHDPASGSVEAFALPSEDVSPFIARIETGQGARSGKVLLGWESTLLEVDSVSGRVTRLTVPLDPAKIDAGVEPPTTRIYDLAVDKEGTVWVSRDHYPYLIAIYADGSSEEFALPEGAGSPEWLAVDGKGRIWATLIRHRRVEVGPDRLSVNSHRFTLRFDPKTGRSTALPIAAYNISGRGGAVVAMAGDQPAGVQRLDTNDSDPVILTEFGPTFPGDQFAVGVAGDVWYHSSMVMGLSRVAGSSLVTFPLSIQGPFLDNNLGVCINCPTPVPQSQIASPVLAVAAATDGSAWFSVGDRIGHAVP